VVRLCLSLVLAVRYRQRCPGVLIDIEEAKEKGKQRKEGRRQKR
jgi:hypothetical protein